MTDASKTLHALETPAARLKFARFARGYRTAKAFSDRNDIPQPTYSNHESGARDIRPEVAEHYGRLLDVAPSWILYGEGRGIIEPTQSLDEIAYVNHDTALSPVSQQSYFVEGEVEAGSWREVAELPDDREPLLLPLRPEYRDARRFGLRTRGPSMNRVYPEGTILDCIAFIGSDLRPRAGDRVIVHRRNYHGLIEATVKELQGAEGAWELWPRSTHPAYQEPLRLDHIPADDENEDLRIVALVIGSYRPEAR